MKLFFFLGFFRLSLGSQANIFGSVGSFWTDVAGVAGAAVAVALAVAIGAARRTNKSGNIASNSHTNFLQCITQKFSVSRFPFPVFPFARVACGTFPLSDSTRVFRGFSAFPVSRFPRWPQITGTKWPPRAAPQEPLGLRSAVRFSFFLQFLFKCWQHCCDCVKSRAKSASRRGSPAKDLPAVTPPRMPSTICNYQSTSTRLNSSQFTFSLRRSFPPLLFASCHIASSIFNLNCNLT